MGINKNSYDPNNTVKIKDEDHFYTRSDFFETKADNLFHIGQSYDQEVAETVYCKNCGGKEFNVGSGDYFTAIRCTKCQWETCIHDG